MTQCSSHMTQSSVSHVSVQCVTWLGAMCPWLGAVCHMNQCSNTPWCSVSRDSVRAFAGSLHLWLTGQLQFLLHSHSQFKDPHQEDNSLPLLFLLPILLFLLTSSSSSSLPPPLPPPHPPLPPYFLSPSSSSSYHSSLDLSWRSSLNYV